MTSRGARLGGGAAAIPFEPRARRDSEPRGPQRSSPPAIDVDAALAAACLLAVVAAPYSAWAGAAMAAGLAPLYLVLRRVRLWRALRPRLFLFLPGAVALLGVVWSASPRLALTQALELGLTALVGALLASAARPESVIKALAVAFAAAIALTITLGGQLGAASGLAEIAGAGLIATVAALLLAHRARDHSAAAGFGLAAAYEGCALLAHAGGPGLGELCLSLAPVAVLGPLARAPKRARLAGVIATMIVLPLVSVWARGASLRGVELALAAGWAQLLALAASVVIGAAGLSRRYAERPAPAIVFWIALLVFELPRLAIGGAGIAPLTAGALALFAGLGAGFGRLRGHARQPRRPSATVISLDEARVRWGHAHRTPGRDALRLVDDVEREP